MDEGEETIPLGKLLEDAGWRQCSVFRPDSTSLPDYLEFDAQTEWLVVCTQSCSICSRGPNAEPTVEVMVAKPLVSISPNSPLSKGHVIRLLQVSVDGLEGYAGLEVDVGRRAFLSKKAFERQKPTSIMFPDESLKLFQGWMSRYYSRVALPEELVKRLRAGKKNNSIHERVEAALKQNILSRERHRRAYEDVHRIYVYCDKMVELPRSESYHLTLLFVCTHKDAMKHLSEALAGLAFGVRGRPNDIGIVMSEPEVLMSDDVTLDHVKDMWWMTAWDNISGLDPTPEHLG